MTLADSEWLECSLYVTVYIGCGQCLRPKMLSDIFSFSFTLPLPNWLLISIRIYSGIVRFPCDSMAFLLRISTCPFIVSRCVLSPLSHVNVYKSKGEWHCINYARYNSSELARTCDWRTASKQRCLFYSRQSVRHVRPAIMHNSRSLSQRWTWVQFSKSNPIQSIWPIGGV